jgi:hypothetical protein
MKNFLNTLYEFGLHIGRIRAASAFARAGMYKEAKAVMLAK